MQCYSYIKSVIVSCFAFVLIFLSYACFIFDWSKRVVRHRKWLLMRFQSWCLCYFGRIATWFSAKRLSLWPQMTHWQCWQTTWSVSHTLSALELKVLHEVCQQQVHLTELPVQNTRNALRLQLDGNFLAIWWMLAGSLFVERKVLGLAQTILGETIQAPYVSMVVFWLFFKIYVHETFSMISYLEIQETAGWHFAAFTYLCAIAMYAISTVYPDSKLITWGKIKI